ncbi:hypothetical protein CY34DRAFT_429217 [Suillus luteus UH-Slu-Lm8-n1]|uniref:Uncharacterized protein n=1 Tax=Suillus luteus UH-Slu-Lm8-n1 TaxID=930992 RepID=A0A0D0BTW6_9AGAM|nr:hypothetical protein CY34DRAFT_429217 [Suillus luteus UH-Slu-Lm8-n1]
MMSITGALVLPSCEDPRCSLCVFICVHTLLAIGAQNSNGLPMKELLTEMTYFKTTAAPALFIQHAWLDCTTLISLCRDSIASTMYENSIPDPQFFFLKNQTLSGEEGFGFLMASLGMQLTILAIRF